ncbi:KR domain-containing protein [Cystobacter fuscus]
MVARTHGELPTLRGVLHCAGVLDDGILEQQELSRFREVLTPKIQGAWNLHALTRDEPLDFFVLYSSMSALLGMPGQGNYAAANAAMDALAHHRRQQGLPALSVNWGPFSEVGRPRRGPTGASASRSRAWRASRPNKVTRCSSACSRRARRTRARCCSTCASGCSSSRARRRSTSGRSWRRRVTPRARGAAPACCWTSSAARRADAWRCWRRTCASGSPRCSGWTPRASGGMSRSGAWDSTR